MELQVLRPNWDWNILSTAGINPGDNLKALIKKIRQHGIEPIVQVGFDNTDLTNNPIAGQAATAASIVQLLNSSADPDHHVTYWAIANEPDGELRAAPNEWGFGYNSQIPDDAADQIEDYIRPYSQQMKAVATSVTIKIIGPGLSTYYTNYQVYKDLTDAGKTNCNIIPYIDIFSYNFYPFGDQNKPQIDYDVPASRDNIIKYLSGLPSPATFANTTYTTNPFRNVLSEIRTRLNNNGGSSVEIAISEANICHKNDVAGDDGSAATNNTTADSDDEITGTGANSFIAGQFWAEMLAECMRANDPAGTNAKLKFLNFWSIKEGNSQSLFQTNIGYLNNDPNRFGGEGGKKPTFHHFKMMATHMKGNFYKGTCATYGIKACGAKQDCGNLCVMVMNQTSSNQNYSVRLDNTYAGGGVQIKVDAHIGKTLPLQTIPAHSTQWLIIDNCNNLLGKFQYTEADCIANSTNPNYQIPFIEYSRRVFCSKDKFCNIARIACSNTNLNGHGQHYPTQVLTNSLTISDSAWINGLITVPNNVTLTIDKAQIAFVSTAKIHVEPGGKLEIKDSYLHGCSGDSWEGISVKGNNNISGQLIMEGSKISDAITAIKTERTNNISITESFFEHGTTAILLERNKGFEIRGNQFADFTYGIRSSHTLISNASIKENYFSGVKYAIYFENDNQMKTEISCNKFEDYTEYAIYSKSTNLKDQGSLTEGAGNEFVSSSTQPNDKLFHQGNIMKYYYDPSEPLSLSNSLGMTAIALPAANDGSCRSTGNMRMANLQEDENIMLENNIRSYGFGKGLNCYPNPVSEIATVVYELPEGVSGDIIITGILGNEISKYSVKQGSGSIEINCSDLSTGIYFFTLMGNNSVMGVRKITIAR